MGLRQGEGLETCKDNGWRWDDDGSPEPGGMDGQRRDVGCPGETPCHFFHQHILQHESGNVVCAGPMCQSFRGDGPGETMDGNSVPRNLVNGHLGRPMMPIGAMNADVARRLVRNEQTGQRERTGRIPCDS